MNKTHSNTDHDLDDAILEALITECFLPLEDGQPDAQDCELDLTDRDVKTLDWYTAKGWRAFRLEPTDSETWATLVRWSADSAEIALLEIDRNGVEYANANFSYSPKSVAWLAAAIATA